MAQESSITLLAKDIPYNKKRLFLQKNQHQTYRQGDDVSPGDVLCEKYYDQTALAAPFSRAGHSSKNVGTRIIDVTSHCRNTSGAGHHQNKHTIKNIRTAHLTQ